MEAISRQHQDHRDLAFEAIGWIAYARRPLRTVELLHALAIEIGEPDFDAENIPDLRDVISMCRGLITEEAKTGTMRLIHYTTQEFFKGDGSSWLQAIHSKMAQSCVAYLSLNSFSVGITLSEDDSFKRHKQFPFYNYASCFWGDYVMSEADRVAVQQLFDLSKNLEATIQALSRWLGTSLSHIGPECGWTGLHLIAYFGLADLIPHALQTWDIQSTDRIGRTALMVAAQYGREAMAGLLIDHGADLEVVDFMRSTALRTAISYKQEAMSRSLIEKGAQINVRDIFFRTPLMLASSRGLEATVQLLIDKGVQLEDTDDRGHTALWWATCEGHCRVIELLIKSGAQVDTADKKGVTPLMKAATECNFNAVKLLVENGAELNPVDRNGQTSLMKAVTRHNNHLVIKLLIEHGAQLNSVDWRGCTALMNAVRMGTGYDMIELLIKHGAQLDLVDKEGQTALMYTAKWPPQSSAAELLIRSGARLDLVNNEGYTAFTLAIEEGYKEAAKLLVESSAKSMFKRNSKGGEQSD